MLKPFVFALLGGCAITSPFQGPMYTPGEGLTPSGDDQYVVAVTNIRVLGDGMDLFDMHVEAITESLDKQPGFVGSALRAAIPGRERWTMTVWTDEQSMMDFVMGTVHGAAMQDTPLVMEQSQTTHFNATASEIPVPWDLALAKLDEVSP